jgi:hypothetical protein
MIIRTDGRALVVPNPVGINLPPDTQPHSVRLARTGEPVNAVRVRSTHGIEPKIRFVSTDPVAWGDAITYLDGRGGLHRCEVSADGVPRSA